MKIIKHTQSSKKGFTLMELLVVVAIIAILGGLAYGPIVGFMTTADVTKTKKICKDITFAIEGFQAEYDSLPYTGTYPSNDENVTTDSGDLLEVLMGINTDFNDKAKKFFTADRAKGDRDGLVYSGDNVSKLIDKWNNPYTIRLDYGANGIIDATKIGNNAEGPAYKTNLNVDSAIVASPGPDQEFNDKQDAKSW